MRRILIKILAGIGGVTVLLVLGVLLGVLLRGKGHVSNRTVLEVDFERALVEYVPDDPLSRIIRPKVLVVRDVVEALERASEDARVEALIARVGATGMGLAQIQEIRDAVLAFRSSGKPAVAYAETFGEFGPGNGAYYLATAFEQVYLQPSGDVGLTGLIAESPFLKGTLEKLGIVPRLDHRHEYKGAMNQFTEQAYTEPQREAMEKIITSLFGQIVSGIARVRGLSEAEVRALVDRGPFLGQEAVDAGLVDGLAYRDEVYERVVERAGEGAEFLYLSTYLERAGRPHTEGETVALIYGVGPVLRGQSQTDPLSEYTTMGSDTVTRAFRTAVRDEEVRAILFRVDSPGGSYVASDAIWRETVRAKEAGKPVVVSMGDVAGSGGYFVAMAADRIVAQPATLTGSIGVLGGKMLTSGLWEKIGLSWDEIHTGKNATMWTGNQDFTPAQWTRLQAWLDRVYDDFTDKVAQGRDLSKQKVLEVARGRVWTGEDARDLGLVDDLGGFPTALKRVREAMGIAEDAPVRLKVFPKKRSVIEMILEPALGSSEARAAVLLARVLKAVQPVIRLVREVGPGAEQGVLQMPEVTIR